MKQFPKIEYYDNKYIGQNIIAFDKIDGQNLRFEFSKKSGWYKFGTRNIMINKNDPDFGDAIQIFLNKYADDLEKVFKKEYSNTLNIVVFCEYHGLNSFAGKHVLSDGKTVTLFDVNIYRRGFITPNEFIENFGHLDIPKIIYKGELNEKFINSVKNNEYNLSEGVICKGSRKTKGDYITWMIKIKTLNWLAKIKSIYGEEFLLQELNKDKKLIELYANI